MKYFPLTMRAFVALLFTSMCWLSAVAQESTPEIEDLPSRAIAFYPEETGSGTFVTLEVAPGATASFNVVLGNAGEIEQTLRTYAASATTATNGGFVLSEYGAEQDEITSWVQYPEQTYTFAPGEGTSIEVTVSVPEAATPGEYVTGLATEQVEAFQVSGTEMVVQRVRWSIPVLIVVPGEREPSFELTDDAALENRDGIIIATVGIANTGNVIVRPTGEVKLVASDGTVVGVSRVALDSIYTGTETNFIVAWENVQTDDEFSLQVDLTLEDATGAQSGEYAGLTPTVTGADGRPEGKVLEFTSADFAPATDETPPSLLLFSGEISNTGDPTVNARVSIVTYKDGEEVDRYPIMQAVTIATGTTPIEARYSLPGGFTQGTYTFEVTIETGDAGTQSVLVTQPIDYEIVVP